MTKKRMKESRRYVYIGFWFAVAGLIIKVFDNEVGNMAVAFAFCFIVIGFHLKEYHERRDKR